MPASIFSETELARWARFPEEIPGDDLISAFTLTGADRDLVAIRRGAANRLGLALQLCAFRYLGFVPRNLSAAPRSAALLCRGPARLGRLVLDPDIPDEPLLRPRDGSYLDFVENRYGPLRKFAPLVLRVLDFKSLKTDDPLIDAVEILRELNRKRRRRVPAASCRGLGRWNPLLLRWPAIPRSRLGGERDRAPEIFRPRKGPHFLHLDLGPVLAVRVEGHLVYGS